MALVCYHGDSPHRIDRERADVILASVTDPDRLRIIGSIRDEFKPAHRISQETGLPASTVYRKIRELHERNLLISSGRITAGGRRESLYQSKIRKVAATFEGGDLDLRVFTNLRDG